MRCVVQYFPALHPPLLQLSIHHAPHRRMHIASIQRYREDLQKALNAAAVPTPIGPPGILEDDGLISKVTASKYFPGRTAQ